MSRSVLPADIGFGRSRVAPLVSRFVRRHAEIEVQLQLSVNPPPLTDDAFDVCVRFGAPSTNDGGIVVNWALAAAAHATRWCRRSHAASASRPTQRSQAKLAACSTSPLL